MPRHANCYEILIASPGDVLAERQIMVECIEDWNAAHSRSAKVILQPRRWELDVYPEMGVRPQETINSQIVDNADMVFGVFWHRAGTPSGVAQSGTIEEIERSVERKKPVFLYFSQAPVPMTHDAAQLATVSGYKERMRKRGVSFDFADVHELRRMVSRHLATKMNALTEAPVASQEMTGPEENKLARLRVRVGQRGRSGNVTTINVIGELQNLTTSTRIREYSCQLLVQAPLLAFASAHYMAEVKSERVGIRVFRHTEANFSNVPIVPGDPLQVVSVEIAIEHLEMKELTGLSRQEAHDLVMNGAIIAEATVDGKFLRAQKPIREIFSLAGGSGHVPGINAKWADSSAASEDPAPASRVPPSESRGPKIELLDVETQAVHLDESEIWRIGEMPGWGARALLLPFYLDPKKSPPGARVEYAMAHLVFVGETSVKTRVAHGCWINAPLDCTELRPGETKYLILAIGSRDSSVSFLSLSTNRTSVAWEREAGGKPFEEFELSPGKYKVEITLIWGGNSEFREIFQLPLAVS